VPPKNPRGVGRDEAFRRHMRVANRPINQTGLNGRQLLYSGIGAGSSWQELILDGLGWEWTPANGPRICADWDRWDAESGFDYRCTVGAATIGDQERLAAGDEPRPDAPAPPYIDLLA
jgi:hypothetical protein